LEKFVDMEWLNSLDMSYYLTRGAIVISLIILGVYIVWIYSDQYLQKKIYSSCLDSPVSLNKLLSWRRRDHDFIKALRRELIFLGQFFKYHDNPADEDIKHYAVRSLNDEEYYV